MCRWRLGGVIPAFSSLLAILAVFRLSLPILALKNWYICCTFSWIDCRWRQIQILQPFWAGEGWSSPKNFFNFCFHCIFYRFLVLLERFMKVLESFQQLLAFISWISSGSQGISEKLVRFAPKWAKILQLGVALPRKSFCVILILDRMKEENLSILASKWRFLKRIGVENLLHPKLEISLIIIII